ncbi:MAG TPA: hypothetical protein VLS49_13230 [Usitatibacter sp.]|nr:hypothetical protein [Usitatibacter sp.]
MVTSSLDIQLPRPAGERKLYVAAALVAAALVFAGFAPTFYLRSAFGSPELSTLKVVHGVVMTAWFTLFIVQARLVATGRTATHRKLGVAGIALALGVLVLGTELGIASARAGVAPVPGISPLVFLVMPIGEMVVFAILVTAGIALRRRPAYHKRLMLLASVAMLTPAMARLSLRLLPAGGPPIFFGLADLVILGCIAYDTARNRRLHPAFAWGFAVVILGQFGRLALSQTPQWMAFAKWLVG